MCPLHISYIVDIKALIFIDPFNITEKKKKNLKSPLKENMTAKNRTETRVTRH